MAARRLRRSLSALMAAGIGVIGLMPGTATSVATAVVRVHPWITDQITGAGVSQTPPDTNFCLATRGYRCYSPAQMRLAYDLQPLYDQGFNGRGRTIVIVDAFGSPTIKHDLKVFDKAFGLPDPPSFRIIQPAGEVPPFSTTAFGGDMVSWAQETTLDVEWSHVIAPGANILLVETPTDEVEGITGFPEIVKAENYVINHHLGDVISQSFGATEETFSSPAQILGLRSAFKNAFRHNVTVLASSGDTGSTNFFADLTCCYPTPVNSWPSSDPLVTSLGGTLLTLDLHGNRLMEDVVWNDRFGATGGGPSHVFSRPEFQDSVANVVGAARGTADISMSGACTGRAIYYYTFVAPGYHFVCGTSESSPLFAGIVAIADQMAGKRLGFLNDRIYQLLGKEDSGIVDVTSGNNSILGVPGFAAGPGYDMASGVGTIDANLFVRALAGEQRGDQNGGGNGG